jgi:pyruvate dehydrogenase kinase 2/3/4
MRATVEELVSRWKDEWQRNEDETPLKNDPELKSGVGHHPRLGIGLAMSYIFARYGIHKCNVDECKPDIFRYFGGSLELVSLDGWGEILWRIN